MNEKTITIKGKMYTSMKRSNHSCNGCHLEGNINAPCGDEPAYEDIDCEEDEIWILKEEKNMKQKIEVGMWVRINSKRGDSYRGHGRIGKVVELIGELGAKVNVNGDILKPLRDSCIPLKQYTINDTFTPEALLKSESCRDSHFKKDFGVLVANAAGDIFSPIKELPSHFYECETMMDKLIGFGFVEEVKEKERTYKRGDEFVTESGARVMLASAPGRWNELFLTTLVPICSGDKGNRYSDNYVRVADIDKVSQAELDSLCEGLILKEDYEKEPF